MTAAEDRAEDINTIVIALEAVLAHAAANDLRSLLLALPISKAALVLDELKQAKLDRATLRNLREAGLIKS